MAICGYCRRCQASCRRGGETVSTSISIFTEAKAALDAYEDAHPGPVSDGSGPHIQTTSPYSVGQAVAEEVSRRTSNAILVMARRWNNDLSATFGILDRLNERPSPELEDAIDNVKHLKVPGRCVHALSSRMKPHHLPLMSTAFKRPFVTVSDDWRFTHIPAAVARLRRIVPRCVEPLLPESSARTPRRRHRNPPH